MEKYFKLEAEFKSAFAKYIVQEDWLLKVRNHFERLKKKLRQKKLKKLRKFCKNENFYFECLERFESHDEFFSFKYNFASFCKSFVPDFDNLHYFLTLNDTCNESTSVCDSCKTVGIDLNLPNKINGKSDNEFLEKSSIHKHLNEDANEATILNGRLKGEFVSKNAVNLPKRKLSKSEISLLSKGLKFIPASNTINKAKLKVELEVFGRMLRLKWFFRDHEKEFNPDKIKPKSTFKSTFELYLSSLEKKLISIEIPKDKYNNLTREEWGALFDLKNDKTIVIKGADKWSAVVAWDRDDYIQEAEKQLRDKEIYEEVSNDPQHLIDTIHRAAEKIRRRGDLSADNIKYFMVKDPKFARFYLRKIHNRLENVLGQSVISNCGFYTENISAFLDFHLQPLAREVKSYIKDTNGFLTKLRSLTNLPNDIILCSVDVVGLYPNIPHDEGLSTLQIIMELRRDKKVSTSTLVELAEVALKNNVFTFGKKNFESITRNSNRN